MRVASILDEIKLDLHDFDILRNRILDMNTPYNGQGSVKHSISYQIYELAYNGHMFL